MTKVEKDKKHTKSRKQGKNKDNHVGEKGEVEKRDASTNREGSKLSRKRKEVVEQATTLSDNEKLVEMNHAKRGKKDDDAKQQEKAASKSIQQDTAVVNKKSILSREEKKKEKQAILNELPKVDENGISYTKMEIRRMMKRVKKGLSALPSDQEKRELAKHKIKEEEEWQALMYDEGLKRESVKEVDTDDDGNDQDDNDQDDNDQDGKGEPPKGLNSNSQYQNDGELPMSDTNEQSKVNLGTDGDSKNKVFVSGMPFGVTHAAIEAFFRKAVVDKHTQTSSKKDKLVTCKIVRFADSGKCRGQAYVAFATEELAQKALKLDGASWPSLKEDDANKRWLSIKPMMNRKEIPKRKQHHKSPKKHKKQSKVIKRKIS